MGAPLAAVVLSLALGTALAAEPVLDPQHQDALATAQRLIATRHASAAATQLELLLPQLADAPYARALAYELLGQARAGEGNLAAAGAAFVHALASAALPPAFVHGITYNLAQIAIRDGRYQEGLGYLERWLRAEKAPGLAAHQLAAVALTRINRCRVALPHLRIAARAPGAEPVWQRALGECERAAAQDDSDDGAVRELLRREPDSKARWLEAIARYRAAHRDAEALALLEVLARRGMAGPAEFHELARGCLAAGLPNKAAVTLSAALADGRLPRERATLLLLGDAWRQARERDRALAAYREAAAAKADGNLYFDIGTLAVELERWREAVAALELALDQPVLRDPAGANLLLGIAALRSGDFDLAEDALATAGKVLATRDAAQWWLRELTTARAAAAGAARSGKGSAVPTRG
ncbi:MAG: hypothetical protein HY749_05430 [Gammaproteobacteria bacterium]|nr:hypothetical protein [Gammaproteobacteria bacterium]